MPGSIDFAEKFGDVSFCDMPFCDGDNLALCQISYMPMEKVVSESFSEQIGFGEACEKMFEFNGSKHIALGLVLTKDISKLLMKLSKYKRYSEMKITGCKGVFCEHPAVQFGVATYILPDGKNVICFRGTDDSLVGWKEDIDIFTKKNIPSYRLAVEYIENAMNTLEGEFIIIGHSKGGNVALYGAMNIKKKLKNRVIALYNNDGPGFWSYDYLDSDEYKEILPKYHHFVPKSSFVGMFMAHDNDYDVVKSSKFMGAMQHDLASWVMDDDKLSKVEELTKLGKIHDKALHSIIFDISENAAMSFDRVADAVVYGCGQVGLLGFAKHIIPSVVNIGKTVKILDKETIKSFNFILAYGVKSVYRACREVNRKVKIVKEEMSFV